jgi:alanyl aminopeptidase
MGRKAADGYWPDGEFDRETLKGALGAMASDSLAAARQIREPIDHSDKIASAFDSITYAKGGGVLAMLERYVGEDRFRAGVRLHLDRQADGTTTAEDFIESLVEGSERFEIEGAFRSYLEQPGVPLLTVSVDCADAQHPKLDVTQTRYAPLGSEIDPATGQWKIPMCVNVVVDGVQTSSCTLLTERSQSIQLDANSCPTQVHPNADGAGYYRFSMDDAGWDSLIAGASDLAAAEALVLADSLDAAFRAGVVSPVTYVTGMARLANHDAWDVADAATGYFESITDIFEADELGPVQQAFRDIVGPRFARLTDASDAGSELLRQRLQRFLIVAAKDQTMREPLMRQAAARIGLEGEPDPSAADASELETILSVGVQDIGEAFFDLLLEQATASEDPAFRAAATRALARVEDPALVAKLQAAMLAGEFRGTEFRRILFRQIVRVATTELTYAWVKDNDTAVIESIPESFRSRIVPTLGSAFCTVKRADEWQSFIESHADKLAGYERTLAQTTESIRLCAALREARAADLITAFANYE